MFTQPALSGLTIHTSTLDTQAFGLVCRPHPPSCILVFVHHFIVTLVSKRKKNNKKRNWMVWSFSSDLLEQKQELCCVTSSNKRDIWWCWETGVMLCYIIKHERHLVRVLCCVTSSNMRDIWWGCARNRQTNKWRQAQFTAVVDEGAW